MAETRSGGRRAGMIVPLFSIPTSRSWGIGEIADLPVFAAWARGAGCSVVQLLPVNEMADGQSSPYSALTAMAIDPIFIAVHAIPEFEAAGGEAGLTAEQGAQLAEVRRAPAVRHRAVRDLKTGVLRALFERFERDEWRHGTPRAAALREFIQRERWWVEDYTLFRALHATPDGRSWLEWDAPLRDRRPEALAAARETLSREILYYGWLQWIADEQWHQARRDADVVVLGDFPFMVSSDSADVWARQHEFRVDASVGVPPDAFSETGQDWGLPVYRWDVHEASGYEWLRQRTRRCAELFDGFRVDHLVGFYRTFIREPDGTSYFLPGAEEAQREQGERLLALFQESGAFIIAEDLGVIPDFVRESLDRLGVPGMKVVRWERDWDEPEQPFRDPAAYATASVALSGTHDTETVAEWWDHAEPVERTAAAALPALAAAGISAANPFSNRLRDALLGVVFAAGSDLVLIPVQDLFGWRDRINVPAVVDDTNWSWRLPWPADRLADQPEAAERAVFLRALANKTHRL